MKIVVTGAKGMLGSVLVRKLKVLKHQVLEIDLPEYDLTKPQSLEFLRKQEIDFIYNCAAFTAVDRCETEYDQAYAVNALAVKNLLDLNLGVPLLHISTDYVFDGLGSVPYQENTPLNPISAYGKSKAQGEKFIINSGYEKYFIVRTAWLYGPNGKNFVDTIINAAKTKPELKVVNDQQGSPTYSLDFVEALIRFLGSDQYGIYHFTNAGETTWYNFAKEILRKMAINTPLKPCTSAEYVLPASRPKYSVLSLEKIKNTFKIDIPSWQDALDRYLQLRGN